MERIEPEIRDENYARLRNRDVIVIERGDYGWRVHEWKASGSVAPALDYDLPEEAAARAMQIMGLTDPVTPQSWPEEIGLGKLDPLDSNF